MVDPTTDNQWEPFPSRNPEPDRQTDRFRPSNPHGFGNPALVRDHAADISYGVAGLFFDGR
jgi:hypothetical protein